MNLLSMNSPVVRVASVLSSIPFQGLLNSFRILLSYFYDHRRRGVCVRATIFFYSPRLATIGKPTFHYPARVNGEHMDWQLMFAL